MISLLSSFIIAGCVMYKVAWEKDHILPAIHTPSSSSSSSKDISPWHTTSNVHVVLLMWVVK